MSLSLSWDKFVSYLEDGISIIPVREIAETVKGKLKGKKSPFSSWNKFQDTIMSKEELWYQLEKYNVSSVGTICGKVSGNMEAIDIDVKWKQDIDKVLFAELKSVCPDILNRLRINKTPSGGWHLLYRVNNDFIVPGNKKLALRNSDEEELKFDPENKTKCFIETRGEGGYVVAPPSFGYETVKGNSLPVLTIDERNLLINTCISFNEVIKEDKKYESSGQESIYYDENPFESFNKSTAGEQVLLNNGWKFHSKGIKGMNFTRPGSKSGGQHATFLFDKKYFIFFTPNCPFENGKCFHPSTIRAALEFNGDKKQLYRVLVSEGYGRVKPEKEKKLVKSLVLNGGALPANVSNKAKELYATEVIRVATANPYGVFWEIGEKGKWEISRERLLMVANGLGFRNYRNGVREIINRFAYKRDHRHFQDTIKSYIQEEDGEMFLDILSAYELFMQKSGEYIAGRLQILQEEDLLKDNELECYKFYLNGFLLINAEDKKLFEYSELSKIVLSEKIQNREYKILDGDGKYRQFLELACRYEKNKDYIDKILGFLAHEYKDETTAYIIVLTEECADPKQGGGSGKNVFCKLLAWTTTVTDKNGSQVKFDEKFLQSWGGEKIMSISDVPKNFNYLFLKEPSSGSGILKKLYEDEIVVAVEDMPKFIIQSNYGIDRKDGGMARRIRQIEFTNFFTIQKGVDIYFDCHFPKGWNELDWADYDKIISSSIRQWIKCGRKLDETELTEGGKIKQFDQMYGQRTREFIEEYWDQWKFGVFISSAVFNSLYESFCDKQFRISPVKMNDALSQWCKDKKYKFVKDKVVREGVNIVKGKEIIAPEAPF